MGESKDKLKRAVVAVKQALNEAPAHDDTAMNIITAGGRTQVRWDTRKNATAMGQLAFFAEYLEVTGLFERWVQQCPLTYSSPNAPEVRDVLGTWMLSILDGHRRYAHVAGIRNDAVAPQLLGMKRIIGDESLRRALAHIAPAPRARHNESEQQAQQAQLKRAEQWMDAALQDSVQHALDAPWILDIDTTIKTLYGHQSGAEISYNPHKPGRPSHAIHTYWIANLRLILQAQVQSGKSHSSAHTLPGLVALITPLSPAQRPYLVRGDCGFGHEGIMCELEAIDQAYLFKLKQTSNVRRLIERQWQQRTWHDAGQGWEACEDSLKLMGWTQSRRVIIMRHAVRANLVAEITQTAKSSSAKRTQSNLSVAPSAQLSAAAPQAIPSPQTSLQFIDENAPTKLWEYAVLVTNTDYNIEQMGQQYRDRADCENGFDELKNQWGWGGYSTQDIERCNLSARAVALIYNWWSWYVRLAHPKARLEAITSRPLLLAAVGRKTEHGGQTRLLLCVTHAAADKVKALIANVRAGLQHILATAPQLPSGQRWQALVRYIVDKMMAANRPTPDKIATLPSWETG